MIVPSRPETGYGYIKRGEAPPDVSVLEQFVEKPDQSTAEAYIASRERLEQRHVHVHCGTLLESLGEFQPETADVCERAMAQAERDMDFILPDA